MVKFYKGVEITPSIIETIKNIAYSGYPADIYSEYFNDIYEVDDLAYMQDVEVADEVLVLGDEWFLLYTDEENFISFLEWVSNESNNKIRQSIEMMNILRQILIQNKDKMFIAGMRHNSSYQMYKKMLQRGYFEEESHECTIDTSCSEEFPFHYLAYSDINYIEKTLELEENRRYKEYFKYIIHQLIFGVTDKLSDDYGSELIKQKILEYDGDNLSV